MFVSTIKASLQDNGTITGVTNSRSNVDRITGTRSYAASTYYCRAASRNNFHVLMGAQVGFMPVLGFIS